MACHSLVSPKKLTSKTTTWQKIATYLAILVGYFFYCYNFVIIDYVRPYLVESYPDISLEHTAQFYTWQSAGALMGALSGAWIAGKIGKKWTLIAITLLNGSATLINLMFTHHFAWFVMRLIVGISLGGYFTIAIAMITSLFEPTVRGKLTAFASSMFSVALIVMGIYGGFIASVEAPWESLMWLGGLPPVITALLMILIIPSDQQMMVSEENRPTSPSWGEMFQGSSLRLTIICLLLAGLNFYCYQFFNGFVTTYLKEVREFEGTTIGVIFSISAFGSLLGAWVWGAIADRYGRKVNALGFILASVIVTLFLMTPSNLMIGPLNLLAILGLIYNFCLSSSAIWGGYFSELFSPHLRSFGAALFHGGRAIGMWAPMVVIFIQNRTDLTTAMWGSPLILILAGCLWLLLPETLESGIFYSPQSHEKLII